MKCWLVSGTIYSRARFLLEVLSSHNPLLSLSYYYYYEKMNWHFNLTTTNIHICTLIFFFFLRASGEFY